MNDYDELTRELQARTDGLPANPVSLDDVKRTAHRMRWQRRAIAGTAAAVVLAIAIPVGLSVGGSTDRTTPDLAPKPDPIPTETTQVVLTTDAPEGSGGPAVPYLYDGAINLPDGSQVEVSGSYDGLAAFGDGWVVTGQDEQANRVVTFLDADGEEVGSYPIAGTIALSRDGTLLSYYGTSDNTLHVIGPDGFPGWTLPTGDVGEAEIESTLVFGSQSCEATKGPPSCSVWSNDRSKGVSIESTSDGSVSQTAFISVAGNKVDTSITGTVSIDDVGSCSRMSGPDGDPTWDTCDHTLGKFSPDGRLVMGHPAYRDGVGDGLVAILDAANGNLVAEFQNNEQTQAFINNAVWETDTTLLATVSEKGAWSLMRMSMDGELTKVMDLEGGEDYAPPLFLPVVP